MDEVQMEHRLAEVEQRSKSNTHRIDELAQEQKDIREDISEVKKDVKSLTNLPAKRWNDVIEKIVWLVLGGAVAALLAQAGIHV